MVVDYDGGTGSLNVTITHHVSDPETHYVDRLRVEVDGDEEVDEDYTSQPTADTFTYTFNVSANASVQIKVRTECNQGGDIEEEIEFGEDPGNGIDDNQTTGDPSAEIDGLVAAGEYDFSFSFGGGELEVHWSIVGSDLHMALVGETPGWISFGFDYSRTMADSDMVFGYVDGTGTAVVYDQWSFDPVGPHPSDTSLGGTYDITAFNGTEADGVTTIEFVRPLDTGDPRDNVIPTQGSMRIIWATGSSDTIGMHSRAGFGTIDFFTGEASEDEKVELWPYHALLMGAGTAAMLAGILIGIIWRKKRWWLKAHIRLGILGAALTLAGLAMGYYMVGETTGLHFRVTHSAIGMVAVVMTLVTVALAYGGLKLKNLRIAHRWIARITFVVMLIAVMGGLSQAGVI